MIMYKMDNIMIMYGVPTITMHGVTTITRNDGFGLVQMSLPLGSPKLFRMSAGSSQPISVRVRLES